MIVLHPIWLFLAVPLGLSLWLWRMPTRLLFALRTACLTLVVLGLAGVAVRLPSRAGTVVVVADRSLSMPAGSAEGHAEDVRLIARAMGPEDRLAVVSFGEHSAVEKPPEAGEFVGFVHEVGGDASNLTEALETALALVPRDAPGRVVVLSDGRWTGRAPDVVKAKAAARGIAIDYRPVRRAAADDLAVGRLDAPSAVAAGESFLITAWVQSPSGQTVSYELRRGDTVIARGEREVVSGQNRLTFRDRAHEAGSQGYTLVVRGSGQDPVPENNSARLLVGVGGPKPFLHVCREGKSGLADLLTKGGLLIETARPEECQWSLERLARYSGVLLENVPAEKVGTAGMESLAAWVERTGAGMVMTGGRSSYGPGGYYRSPLEPILPVSMELRQEHRKLALAIVVVLDRSGSMSVQAGGGRSKMDLANLGTAQVLDLLGPMDEFGVIAVDSAPHTVSELGRVTEKESIRSKVLSIESMGGGIFIFEALRSASAMIAPAEAGTKHIILFADAMDSEEPGDYQELLEKCRKAGITVSVIGLGTEHDIDAELLRDIAKRGEGRCFFTDKPEELPRLFAQDTFVVARSTFLDEPTAIAPTAGLATLTGKDFPRPPSLGGYNLCYLRPRATLATITRDEYKAPVVAAWPAGSGRVVCFTGEADGEYAGDFARWEQAGEYHTSLVRWAAGARGNLGEEMLLTQEVRKGVNVIRLHLDPDRKAEPFSTRPRVTTLREQGAGEAPGVDETALNWVGPDTLEIAVPLSGRETALSAVEVAGHGTVALPPVRLPYSPEFEPTPAGRGLSALEGLGRATGGMERVELAGIWEDLPPRARWLSLAPYLLGLAAVLLLVEVFERRTGLLTRRRRVGWGEKEKEARERRTVALTSRQSTGKAVAAPEAPATPAPADEGDGGVAEALRQARKRLRSRGR
jgi:Mg-chelatase subunit ChlD